VLEYVENEGKRATENKNSEKFNINYELIHIKKKNTTTSSLI